MKPPRLTFLLLGPLCAFGAFSARAQTVVQNVTYSSTATVLGPTTIDANTAVTVASGANITFQASTRIRLGPGFTAANGSAFHAMLGTGSTQPPVITSSGTAGGAVGTAFHYTITATNAPTGFNASGLPSALSVNPSTGAIFGTPGVVGTFTVSLSASNANGTGTRALTLTILSGGDSDSDGVPNAIEQVLGTNPNSGATSDSTNQTDLRVHRP